MITIARHYICTISKESENKMFMLHVRLDMKYNEFVPTRSANS